MKKHYRWHKLFLVVMILPLLVATSNSLASTEVFISKQKYAVELVNSERLFLQNKKSAGTKVGTKVFLTYTVKSVQLNESKQFGVIGTSNPDTTYPYLKDGIMYYDNGATTFFDVGYTYFFKFELTKDGLSYTAARAKGQQSEYVKFSATTGETVSGMEYFGIWSDSGPVTAELNDVHCYDEKGNDLGIKTSSNSGSQILSNPVFQNDEQIGHIYKLDLLKGNNVAISSAKPTDADTVYIEYTVKSATLNGIYQSGVILTTEPKSIYPFNNTGQLYYEQNKDNNIFLMLPSARYIIQYIRSDTGFQALVQRTYKNKTIFYEFPLDYGKYKTSAKYFSIWFGEGTGTISCILENVKCYDSKKNNLGIQCNNVQAIVTHYGENEDYSDIDAVYYNQVDNTIISLSNDKKVQINNGTAAFSGTFKIVGDTCIVETSEGKTEYKYRYMSLINSAGAVYKRVRSYVARFDTRGGSEVLSQVASSYNLFRVVKPDDPSKSDAVFEGWYLGDGTKFDFASPVLQSATLYARWSGANAIKFEPLKSGDQSDTIPLSFFISAGVGLMLIILSMVVSAILFRKISRRHKKVGV